MIVLRDRRPQFRSRRDEVDTTANSHSCALRGQHRGSPGYPPGALSAHAEYLDADAAAVAHLRRAGLYDDYSALTDLEASLSKSLDGMLASESPLLRGDRKSVV